VTKMVAMERIDATVPISTAYARKNSRIHVTAPLIAHRGAESNLRCGRSWWRLLGPARTCNTIATLRALSSGLNEAVRSLWFQRLAGALL
jgi:hypothetical protein